MIISCLFPSLKVIPAEPAPDKMCIRDRAYTNQKLEVRLGGLDNIEQRLQDLNEILTEVVGTTVMADQILYIDMRYEGSPLIKLRS